jgi:two-component system chemotaxis sensor kinase CheA
MKKERDDFLKKLLSTFKVEAGEHIQALSSGLIELEKASSAEARMGIIEIVFREAHSLKGAARAVNLTVIEALCQALEGVFSALKRQDIALSPTLLDLLHNTVDTLGKLLSSAGNEPSGPEKSWVAELIQHLDGALKGVPAPTPREQSKHAGTGAISPAASYQPMVEEKVVPADTVRISTAKLDSLLLQIEELLSAKQAADQRTAEIREIHAALAAWNQQQAKIDPEARIIQQRLEREGSRNGLGKTGPQVRKLLEFLEWGNAFVKSLEGKLAALKRSAERDHRFLGGMVDNLLYDMKKVLMLPFSSALEVFPKLVRDLSRDQGKEVELLVQGEEIEIDRRILEEMKDPLIHLVRNCINHGIESPGERERKMKPRRGTITFAIAQKDGGKIEILVADDGAGIDVAKVREAAQKLGIVSAEDAQNLDERETLSLIFQSGVSTSPIITAVSGRGLGLTIVREKVEKLGGVISLETHPDLGTSFRIVLPLTLATFRGIYVRVDEHHFVFPTMQVAQAVRVNKDGIKTVENRETIRLNGQPISLIRLREVMELPHQEMEDDSTAGAQVVVIGSAEKRIAFLVSEILDEQEVLVKSLGNQLPRVRNIAGATVLGTGKVVPILNVPDLMESAVRVSAAPPRAAVARETVKAERKSILVVEDSITARMLLKNILESAGYRVETAVDGIDAFTILRTEGFDLMVSDVEMPRMDGFDLTAKIRADKALSELPVVLVTALESREHRERGIDVGANAYIVKSSFDQSNLLEVIRRLA